MKTNQIYLDILELCSESEYGSWEFWLSKPKKRTIAEAEIIIQSILRLIEEGNIYPMDYNSVKDRSYTPTQLNVDKLRSEIIKSMNPENVNSETSYWFLATEKGQKEDIALRSN